MADTRKEILTKQFANPELSLTPEEINALNYHRQNLAPNKYLKQKDGDITTYYGAVEDINGKPTYFPTYWGGKILSVEDAKKQVEKSGIKFPTYKTIEEALKREQVIHDIMSNDVKEFLKKNKE